MILYALGDQASVTGFIDFLGIAEPDQVVRMKFLSTVVPSDVLHISPGSLLLLFSAAAFVVPSFPAFAKTRAG